MLARYVAREGSADEMSHVAQWLEANPTERALLGRLSDVTAAWMPTDIDVEAALAKVHAQMGEVRKAPTLTVNRSATRRRWQPMAIGGLLAAAAVVGVLVVTLRTEAPGAPTAAAAQTFATSVGKRDSITLADGSLVLLGPDSRLTVPAGFAGGSRPGELRGDA